MRPNCYLTEGSLIFHFSLEDKPSPSTVPPVSEQLSGDPWVLKRGGGSVEGPAVPWEV